MRENPGRKCQVFFQLLQRNGSHHTKRVMACGVAGVLSGCRFSVFIERLSKRETTGFEFKKLEYSKNARWYFLPMQLFAVAVKQGVSDMTKRSLPSTSPDRKWPDPIAIPNFYSSEFFSYKQP